MFLKTVVPVPEAVTGLIGAAFIGLSFFHSVRVNRREVADTGPGQDAERRGGQV
jgi:hypothetical protein